MGFLLRKKKEDVLSCSGNDYGFLPFNQINKQSNQIMLKNPLTLVLLTMLFIGCSKSESTNPTIIPEEILSDAKEISSFKIALGNEEYTAIIRNDSVLYTFPATTVLTALEPVITFSEKAEIDPASGEAVDFTNPVKYTVTAEDESKKEYMAVLDKYDSEKEIKWVSFDVSGSYSSGIYAQNPADIDTLYYTFTYADITDLQAEIEVSEGATVEPDPAGISDYSSPVKYTVTGADGTTNEVFVWAKNWPLKQVKIDGFVYNEFDEVTLGGDITFEVNELTPYQDSIQVRLFSELESFDLDIKSINEETKEITATLPDSYTNNRFALEVSIASDNTDESDGFRLLNGKLNFKEVMTPYNNGNPIPIETVIWPGHYLDIFVYLKDDAVDDHEFFLLKDGIYYEMTVKQTFNNFITTGIRVEMPDLPDILPEGGTDYKLVIRNAEGEETFDLTNGEGNKINVVLAQAPEVNSLSTYTVQKDGTFKIMGENLLVGPIIGYTNSSILSDRSSIRLSDAQGSSYYIYSDTVDANGNLVIDLSSRSYMPSGSYGIFFSSNVKLFSEVATGLTVTVTQLPSEHPSLEVSNAKLYGNNHASLPKQILLTFNENIDNYNIKSIVTGREETVVIENYFFYPTTVLTGTLTDDEYGLTLRDRDGYVVVEDNGVDYRIYFTLQMEF
ncbi:hypothetical protein HZY62_12415 [Maribacter polysiphoniae]|uniref:Ig-like domain-containing protein n=2 Tax=Maribacter polysiphoniae TaxID=429344 RepID=A0ABR7W0U7_9FLAO|nr:hypothetical protein [Maribacter polysiphoniae]MBD1261399.1 hypothetical protein [Maribacter polysiphoniae]